MGRPDGSVRGSGLRAGVELPSIREGRAVRRSAGSDRTERRAGRAAHGDRDERRDDVRRGRRGRSAADGCRLPSRSRRPRHAARTSRADRLPVGSASVDVATPDVVRLRVLTRRLRCTAVTAVLFTCAGQRVDIVSAFGRAGATTVATDLDPLAPALWHADSSAIAPRIDDDGYVAFLRSLVEEHDVRLVVPLTDLDHVKLVRAREELGALVLLPSEEVVRRVGDKYTAHCFFLERGIPTPPSWLPAEVPRRRALPAAREGARGLRFAPHPPRPRPCRARVLPPLHARRVVRADSLRRARSSRSTSSATSTRAA